ncbi:hypothetical protein IAR55_005392 [Kwoniella newhampshirensis]|uniref:Protein kinase domain-containing protein n=1 Tax=Kwoniella newhampshirensis TaxID=1651941 RepID=A0AAW0YHS9_9TREE
MVQPHPQLTASTQAGPSTPTPPARRPQGARRRGIVPGLFIANPDNSDDDGSPPKSGSQSQRSPSLTGVSPVSLSSSGRGGAVSVSIPQPTSPALSVRDRGPLPLPSIPAPQSSPLPSISAFPSPQPSAPIPSPAPITYGRPPEVFPVPPQPPPQPERHLRRAFTTPVPDQTARPQHEGRTASGSNVHHSPSRALPPLPPIPSPPPRSAIPSPQSGHSPSGSTPYSSNPYPPPTPSSFHSDSRSQTQGRVASPEDALSPAAGSEGGSIMSVGMGNRNRSGSMQGHQVRLQVTTDNEAFHLVDITGINTAEGIREKLRIRDEDHPTFLMYRTEIGEPADEVPILPAALLNLCSTQGDSRATLKFLVTQTKVPPSSAASVIPPVNQNLPPYRSAADTRRAEMSPITTDLPRSLLKRASSRHSKEGSASSASGELLERGGLSASDWSDLGADAEEWNSAQLQRGTRRNFIHTSGVRLSSSTGGSRSPITEPSAGTSSPAIPTPPASITAPPPRVASSHSSPSSRHYESRSPSTPPMLVAKASNATPTLLNRVNDIRDDVSYNTSAGPSRQGLGLNVDNDMDPETRALIEQFQREEREAQQTEEAERRRQLEQDEELALREQQSERELWEMMQRVQSEQRQREQAQDEARAREVAAEQQQQEEQRQALEAARTAWEADQREQQVRAQKNARFLTFERDRRDKQEFYRSRARVGAPIDETATYDPSWNTSYDRPESSMSARRPSDPRLPPRQASGSVPSRQGSTQPVYQSPPGQYTTEMPYPQTLPARRPSGFPQHPYAEASHAQERLSDPRLQQVTGRTSQIAQRGDTRIAHPYAYTRGQSGDSLQAPSLQNARSMDNLRLIMPQGALPHPPYGVPPRTAMTPTPGYPEHRSLQSATYRSPSVDRAHEGRYPEPSHTVPSRVPSVQIPTIETGMLPFPSPYPSSANPATYQHQAQSFSAFPRPVRGNSYDREPLSASRPRTIHYDRSPPGATSPETTTIPHRPSSYYDEVSPPRVARTSDTDGYFPSTVQTPTYGRPRSGSVSVPYTSPLPSVNEPRRVSESSIYDDRDSQLPYTSPSPESSWLSANRYGRSESDTLSVAGTVSSDATVRARDESDSNDTAKAGMWEGHIRDLIGRMTPGLGEDTIRTRSDEDEATLFLSAPMNVHDSPRSFSGELKPSPSKPNLIVNTAALDMESSDIVRSATTPSDSATESEGTGEGTGVRRGKSFARPKDPNQWNFRPEPEQLYENLDRVFPKIDLDQPFVHGAASTPTTPASETASKMEAIPVIHPRQPALSPVAETTRPGSFASFRNKFNKSEARRSIRVVADHKRRTLQREVKDEDVVVQKKAAPAPVEQVKKVERRRSSSMWDHKLVEVTPSKLAQGQVPSSIPESPAADGNSGTVNWVKGELIGKGSYGRVYIALNVTTGDMMAVKQVELPATENDRNDKRQQGMVKALRDEIELLKDLEHRNIVAYLGYETSPEYLSIFLEYVPGGTIASIYRTPNQARFEPQLVRFFTEQVLEGLAYLHSKNIWHRDLKGDNILVDGQGICKISDFGISKQTSDAYDSFGQNTNMKGSVFWMAPEVIHSYSERSYSGKVDIWSLGCVVLEMWSGKRPWGDMEQVAAMFELFNKRARPPLPPDIHLSDTALDFLYNKCLATDPRDRPMARDLLEHRFIKEKDKKWTFAESKIGKAVAKRGAKTVRT